MYKPSQKTSTYCWCYPNEYIHGHPSMSSTMNAIHWYLPNDSWSYHLNRPIKDMFYTRCEHFKKGILNSCRQDKSDELAGYAKQNCWWWCLGEYIGWIASGEKYLPPTNIDPRMKLSPLHPTRQSNEKEKRKANFNFKPNIHSEIII